MSSLAWSDTEKRRRKESTACWRCGASDKREEKGREELAGVYFYLFGVSYVEDQGRKKWSVSATWKERCGRKVQRKNLIRESMDKK